MTIGIARVRIDLMIGPSVMLFFCCIEITSQAKIYIEVYKM